MGLHLLTPPFSLSRSLALFPSAHQAVPPAEDEDPPSAAMEVGRRIDGLHQQLREVATLISDCFSPSPTSSAWESDTQRLLQVTGFLGNVQKSLDTVLSVLEEVEHNVKTLSNQGIWPACLSSRAVMPGGRVLTVCNRWGMRE